MWCSIPEDSYLDWLYCSCHLYADSSLSKYAQLRTCLLVTFSPPSYISIPSVSVCWYIIDFQSQFLIIYRQFVAAHNLRLIATLTVFTKHSSLKSIDAAVNANSL
jgi:hypothetical protein